MFLLSWLPIIGPIVEGIVSMFTKHQDTVLGKYTVDADVKKTEIVSSTQSLIAFKDDIGVRLVRDIIMTPVAVWTSLIVWDKIVAIPYPNLVWGILPLDPKTGLDSFPYAVMTFLFGMAALNTWKSR